MRPLDPHDLTLLEGAILLVSPVTDPSRLDDPDDLRDARALVRRGLLEEHAPNFFRQTVRGARIAEAWIRALACPARAPRRAPNARVLH